MRSLSRAKRSGGSLEAQASGRPVIAYGVGGALETVLSGVTGEFFKEQTAVALSEVVSRFDSRAYDPAEIRRHAEQFDTEVFKRRIAEFIRDQGSGIRGESIMADS